MGRLLEIRGVFVVVLLAMFVGAACSGGPAPSAADPAESPGQIVDNGDSGKIGGGKLGKGKGKSSGKKGGGSGGTSSGGSSGGGGVPADATDGSTVSATGQKVSEKQQAERARRLAKGLPTVNMWPQSTAQMGFTDDAITLCGHAALTFAEAFDTRPEDINVYWSMVNDNGGVYGRDVHLTIEDDAYRPDNAVQAAERCKAKNPFMLIGGIGFDQIPAVRAWNEQEQNRLLYVHHIARQDLSKKYSFSFLPTVEQSGRLAARWILAKHKSDKIGVIWRQSEAWEPGHKTFLASMKSAGKGLVADLPVQKDQAVYTQQIAELKAQGAKTVFVWENGLAAIELIKQAKQQDYHPTWVVFPFQIMTDTLKEEMLNPPVEGIAMWPAYVPGATSGPFAPYAAEIARYEEAQRKYGRAQKGNDILWMTWLAMKQVHQWLLDCGPNCDRNRMVALLISGRHKAVAPNCPFNFKANQHVGGFLGNIFKATNVSGYGPGWVQTNTCVRI
ncbi:MAG TPA: ABC transporter substrate-binding protein [Actinomycetota bacterium]|nr:ABC transporter substrate-binding protein [Actinomycetota bacterium]